MPDYKPQAVEKKWQDRWRETRAFEVSEDPDQPYHIPMIEMSVDLAQSLTYESKLDRSPESINRLILDGEKQGQKFIEARFG